MLLFTFLAILEDCGYLSRAAYLADRLMSSIGLSGKAFIPLLSSFACAVPGIMATRVIENRQERLVTILIAPLMSCSARLPVYVLLIAAFIPPRQYLGGWLGLQGITMTAAYLVGIVTAVVVAVILRSFVFRRAASAFVMELPGYKFPSFANVLLRVTERAWRFLRQAGTLILAASVVVWAMAYYPRVSPETVAAVESGDLEGGGPGSVENRLAGLQLRHSFLGRLGRLVEPVVRPLGWDWRIGCAVIASFPAREVVISTLGVIYNLGDEVDETSGSLRDRLHRVTWQGTDRPVFNVPVALSLMVFFALCAQCAATLVVIRKETNSWFWPLLTFTYMTGLAYLGALATYQIGIRFIPGGV
jgi:ferrous iron transport protein B